MARYVTRERVVVEYEENVVRMFPKGAYVRVPDSTPLSEPACCGQTGWAHLYDGPLPDDFLTSHRKKDD